MSFIDDHEDEIAELEQETANQLSEILEKPVKYKASLTDPSDPTADTEKGVVEIRFTFPVNGE